MFLLTEVLCNRPFLLLDPFPQSDQTMRVPGKTLEEVEPVLLRSIDSCDRPLCFYQDPELGGPNYCF
jgi:hypothetical protein